MLKLREIELLGFKSFADRTRMVCDGSTAAVVGPNGCGKSNLADAVSWVLGEQSARMLRGERMSDVIFNGTGTRPPTGMAEVSMTLVDADYLAVGELEKMIGAGEEAVSGGHEEDAAHNGKDHGASSKRPVFRDGEIKVTRRLFRSGESEYLLNGAPCRLRDIQDIFMGTGLGPESYAIIEQGRIGQILSSRPSDRRAIIEEAAGVSKFKSRKRLAEAKLESSRQNLARINDILEEISKQVHSLKRQATKAAKYRELHNELRSRQKRVFTSRLLTLEAEFGKLQQEFAASQAACSAAAQELETLESARSSAASRYEELEEELKRLREEQAQSEIEAERLRSRLEKSRQQVEALEARITEAQEEQAQLARQAETLDKEAQERAGKSEEVRAEWDSAQQTVARLASDQSELGGWLAAAEKEVEARRQEMLAAVSRAAELRNEAVKTEEMGFSVERQLARSRAEQAAAEEEHRRAAAELEIIQAEHQRNETALAELARTTDEARQALEEACQEEAARRAKVESLSREHSQASARKQALEESLSRHAYSTESVRRLLSVSANGHDFHPLGVLADFLEVAPGYEEVVEEFLKAELDCVVVEGANEAREGISLLESEGSGRSTFFVRSFSANGHTNTLFQGDVSEAREQPGVVASLRELVRFEERLGLNGGIAFPALANSFVVEDAAVAERLAATYPACHFVTRQGEHYHHRLVSGGKASSAGPLALRRDFRELDRRAAELQLLLSGEETRWADAKNRLNQANERLRRLNEDGLIAEKQAMLADEKLRQARAAEEHAQGRIQVAGRETAMLAAEREEIEQRRRALQTELEAATGEQRAKEEAITAAAQFAHELRDKLDGVTRALTESQVKFSALEERWRAAEADRSRVVAEAAQAHEKLARLSSQAEVWRGERQRLEAEESDVESGLAEAEVRQQGLRERLRMSNEESQEVRVCRDELTSQAAAARAVLESQREKRSDAEVALARAESDLNHHVHQCREELGAEPEALHAEAKPDELLEGADLQAAEEELREIKGRLERLGPVNMMALEELQESEERLNFLETQRQDLLASINDTAQTIREIDEASRRKFMEAFKAINAFFAESFRTLFGGGVGEMRFSDETDPESGIDLVAQPPGKRLQNVLLLSGGEKALTALALLIGVFRFTPSPFCILDEVDAPLDESNVVRFTRMIQQMSEQTQFILITHNKSTMEACRLMYGVTMEEPGVSKLVSVRFEAREPVAVAALA